MNYITQQWWFLNYEIRGRLFLNYEIRGRLCTWSLGHCMSHNSVESVKFGSIRGALASSWNSGGSLNRDWLASSITICFWRYKITSNLAMKQEQAYKHTRHLKTWGTIPIRFEQTYVCMEQEQDSNNECRNSRVSSILYMVC